MAVKVLLVPYQAGALAIGYDETHLRPRDAKFLEILVRRKGSVVEEAELAPELWGGDGIEWERSELHHIVSRLRKLLKPVGVTIRTAYEGSFPYFRLRGWEVIGPIEIQPAAGAAGD